MPGGRKRRVVGVCTSCRQDKVQCDSETSFPCSRCQLRGLTCTIDPKFRRTPARQRIQSMADELRQLREAHGSPSTVVKPEQSLSPSRSYSAGLQSHTSQSPVSPADSYLAMSSDGTFDLGLQCFDATEIDERFAIYMEHFHPRLPVLDLNLSKTTLYNDSPFLFWAIITVSCRYEPLVEHDQALFYDGFLSLLRTVALTIPLSLHSIQALLLVCLWPIPAQHQLYESGWLYYSLALGGATYLKLDCAHRIQTHQGSTLGEADIANMSRTWLAVFCVSLGYTTWSGVDLSLKQPSDLAVIDAHVDGHVQSELSARAAISRVSAKHVSQVTDNLSIVTHETLIEMSSADLDFVANKFSDVWSPQLGILLQGTRLSFVASLLVTFGKQSNGSYSHSPGNSTIDGKLSRHTAMGGYLAAQIINAFDVLIGHPTEEDQIAPCHNFFSLPRAHYHVLMFTAFFLVRFCCFNKSISEDSRIAAHQSVHLARGALLRASRSSYQYDDGDEPARSARGLDVLLRCQHAGLDGDLSIDDRSGNSVIWDTVRRIKVLRGQATRETNLLHLINPRITVDEPSSFGASCDNSSIFPQLDLEFMQEFLDIGQFDSFATMDNLAAG